MSSEKLILLNVRRKITLEGFLEVVHVSTEAFREWVKSFVPKRIINPRT